MRRQVEASVLEKPGVISVRKFPIPEIHDGAMLMKPIMCGICGTDRHGFKGEAVQYAGTPREIVCQHISNSPHRRSVLCNLAG